MNPFRFLSKWLLLALLCLRFSAVNGQTPLSLKAAIQYALANHTEVKRSGVELEKGRELVRESLSTGLPQVGVDAQMVYSPSLRTSLVPAEFLGGPAGEFHPIKFGTNWNGATSLYLEQMLFSKTWLMGLKASYAVQDFYRLLLDKTKEDAAYEVAKLYYQVLLSGTRRGILEANLKQVSALAQTLSKQYEQGLARRTEAERLKVQQFNLETELTNLNLGIEQLEQALKFAMNMPFETELILTDTVLTDQWEQTEKLLVQPAYQQKTELAVLKQQMKLHDLDERRWQAGFFPTLSFFATYNYEWQANSLDEFGAGQNWSNYSQIGLRLSAPIFDGFYKDSKRQTALLNKQSAGLQYRQALLALQLQHRNAVSTWQVQHNSIRAIEENLRLAQEVYDVSRSRYEQGLASIVELLDAESSLRQTQSNYLTVLAQMRLAEIDLLHANGLLIPSVNGQ